MEIFQIICGVIVLLGSTFTAVTVILNTCGKPIKFLRKRHEASEKKKREELVAEVSKEIEKALTPRFDEIYQQNLEQDESISILINSSKDMLREAIIAIYTGHKTSRTLTETTRELLDDLYNDYKAEHGNHYIDRIYSRMEKWETVPDED